MIELHPVSLYISQYGLDQTNRLMTINEDYIVTFESVDRRIADGMGLDIPADEKINCTMVTVAGYNFGTMKHNGNYSSIIVQESYEEVKKLLGN